MTTAPITPDLVEWLLADQKGNQIFIIRWLDYISTFAAVQILHHNIANVYISYY